MLAKRILHVLSVLGLLGVGAYLWIGPSSRGSRSHATGGAPASNAAIDGPSSTSEPQVVAGDVPEGWLVPRSPAAPAAGGGAKGTPARAPTLRGIVTDEAGQPIANALVLATDGLLAPEAEESAGRRLELTTAADGNFVLEDLDPGALKLAVFAAGFAPRLSDVPPAFAAEGDHELAPVCLARAAVLEGRVVDADGRAVAGAELWDGSLPDARISAGVPTARGRRLARTSDAGRFRIDQIAPGPWTIRVSAAGHPERTFHGTAERAGPSREELELRLTSGLGLTGRVVGAPPGTRGLHVRALPGSARRAPGARPSTVTASVDEEGRFALEGLPSADCTLQAWRSVEGRAGIAPCSPRTHVGEGEQEVLLTYDEGRSLSFQVVDAASQAPLTSFRVLFGFDGALVPWLGDDGRPLESHAGGAVILAGLFPSTPDTALSLAVQAPGHARWEQRSVFLEHSHTDLGRVPLTPIPMLRLRVRDGASGEPVAGARAWLAPLNTGPHGPTVLPEHSFSLNEPGQRETTLGGSRSATSDATGLAQLDTHPGEACLLRVEAEGYATFEHLEPLTALDPTAEREVRLDRGGEVVVRVRDPRGGALRGMRIEHRSPADLRTGGFLLPGLSRPEVTGADGSVTFSLLQTGRHEFRVAPKTTAQLPIQLPQPSADSPWEMVGFALPSNEGWTRIDVSAGQAQEVVLEASPLSSLAGLIDEEGRPLVGAIVRLSAEGDGRRSPALPGLDASMSARTDAQGRFLFGDVDIGRHSLRIVHPSRAMEQVTPVVLRAGENRLDLSLTVCTVSGRVTDQQGRPLAGIRVSALDAAAADARAESFILLQGDAGGPSLAGGTRESAEGVTTDAEGRYALRGVSDQRKVLVAASGGAFQEARTTPFALETGQDREGVDLVLAPGASIEVEASLLDGSLAPPCAVRVVPLGDSRGVPRTSLLEGESITLSGLVPGRWLVLLSPLEPTSETGPGQELELAVEAGQTALASFTLP